MKTQLLLTGYCHLVLQQTTIKSLADVYLSSLVPKSNSVLILQLQSFKPTLTHLNSMKQATAVLLLVATAMHVASAAVKNFDQKYPYVTNQVP